MHTLARKTALNFIEIEYNFVNLFDKSEITYTLINCYIDAVGDDYAYYRTPEMQEEFNSSMQGGNKISGIGIMASDKEDGAITVTLVIKDSPAKAAGIMENDKIVAVDGAEVAEIGYQTALEKISGDIGAAVDITIKRGDALITYSITRAVITEQTAYAKILEGNIGYIRITSFKRDTVSDFIEAVNELETAGVGGIIFDLTSNTGGYLSSCRDMLSYLVPDGTPLYSMPKENGGAPRLASSGGAYEVEDHYISIPVVYICNGYTASAGELFCAALRDYNTMGLLTVRGVGTTTYGKGIVQDGKLLSSGAYLTLTVDYYNPPSGKNYHGFGIEPDYKVLSGNNALDIAAQIITLLMPV